MDIIIKSKAKSLADRYGIDIFKLHPHARIRLEKQIEKAIHDAIKLDAELISREKYKENRAGIKTKKEIGYYFIPKKKPGRFG